LNKTVVIKASSSGHGVCGCAAGAVLEPAQGRGRGDPRPGQGAAPARG